MKNFYLIDGDNNINLGLRGIEMLTEENYVMIFHSKAMEITKFKKKLSGCRAQVEFIESVRGGKNSLDFQITTELGFLSQQKDLERAYIISCDKGYDAAVEYVKSRYSAKFKELARKESIFDSFQLAFLLKAKTKNELKAALTKEYGQEHGELIFDHLKNLFDEEATKETAFAVEEAAVDPQIKKSTKDRKKTRPERKPKAASGRTKKMVAPEEPKPETVVDIKDLPVRFGNVRTEEQNKSFYKSKDLRKKTKPENDVKEPEKVEVVNKPTQRPPRKREGEQRPSNRNRSGQRPPRREEAKDVKASDSTGKKTPEQRKTEEKPPVQSPSNTGLFGRMFGKKKK